MKYKSYRLADTYSFIVENDSMALGISSIINGTPSKTIAYLQSLKKANPDLFGRLIVRAYTNPTAKKRLEEIFT